MGNKAKEEKIESEQTESVNRKIKPLNVLKTVWKMIWNIILTILVFLVIIIVVQYVSKNEHSFLGFRIFLVETGSMVPKYNVGDVILIKEKDTDKIEVGDDVTYKGAAGTMKGKIVTHQVVNIEMVDGKKVFHTKGIANNIEDPVISGGQIQGVVLGEIQIFALIIALFRTILTNHYLFFGITIVISIYIFFRFVRNINRQYSDEEE